MSEPRSPEQQAHIIVHDQGVGVPSPDEVVQRARELAVIAGRVASEFTEEDFQQAKAELSREGGPREEVHPLQFEPGNGDVLGGTGRQAQNFGSDDESTIGEELIREGLDEALHDEMLEARRMERK